MLFTYSKFSTSVKLDLMHAKVGKFVFRLNYNGNGGTVSTPYKEIKSGVAYGNFPVVTRNGYILNGWWTEDESGTQVTTSTEMGNSDTTIYAHWIKGRYDLVVKPNGGEWETHTADQTYNMEYEEEKNIVDPTKEGYTFTGWTLSGTGSTYNNQSKKFKMGYQNTTLTANYEINTYTLTIDLDDGSEEQEYELDYHETKEIEEPERVGYTFTGWDNIDNISGTTYSQPDHDVKITATWRANDYKWIVYHKKQSVDGSQYTTYETEEGEDAYDTDFSGTVKTYNGFNKPSTQTKKIKVEKKYVHQIKFHYLI